MINARTCSPLLILLAAFGCAASQSQVDLPSNFYPEGDYQHNITGLTFPKNVGRYKRIHVSTYDTESHNVSGHYELRAPLLGVATVYHYPAAADGSFPTYSEIYTEFEAAKREIFLIHESATFVSESEKQTIRRVHDAVIHEMERLRDQA